MWLLKAGGCLIQFKYISLWISGQLSSGCLIQVGCLIEVTTNTGFTVMVWKIPGRWDNPLKIDRLPMLPSEVLCDSILATIIGAFEALNISKKQSNEQMDRSLSRPFLSLPYQPLKCQEKLHLKMSSVYVACWILFLQIFQTYFYIYFFV